MRGGNLIARRGLRVALHPSEGTKVVEARLLEMLLVVAELSSDAGIVTERDDGMNTLPCIGPRFDRRDALLENLGM